MNKFGRMSEGEFKTLPQELKGAMRDYAPEGLPLNATNLGDKMREKRELDMGGDRMKGDLTDKIDALRADMQKAPLLGNVDVTVSG